MVVQPTGTVTLLFTDVEGSTLLLERLGAERFAEVLALHRRLLREAFARHGGYEVDEEGDAFLVAFPAAGAAVAAAAEAQQGLASVVWPIEGGLRVRMGVHTGEPLPVPPKYVGMDVHRAARIMAAAHGGQVLVSETTAALLDGVALRDLGPQRLKDLLEPIRLYQLEVDGLPVEFPALKTLQGTTLPVPATPFIGRERELMEVAGLLAREDARVVTLTGPGGVGKTRLLLQAAAEVSDRFPDGVYWVALAPLRDPSLLEATFAQALDVSEQPGVPVAESVAAAYAHRRALVVLDNCEHLVDAVAELVRLLSERCPTLVVAGTSRERLGLRAERIYAVPSMASSDGELLFLERASAVASEFVPDEHVAAICEAVDGLPLAIELAAARVRSLSPQSIRERLGERLSLLVSRDRDLDERQRTLEATIGWSYDLLDPEEQRALRALSVFAGGCRLDAAEAVVDADLDLLDSLLDKSLIRHRVDDAGNDRYWMLETIREYAQTRLDEAGEGDSARAAHRDHFLGQAVALFAATTVVDVAELTGFRAERANYRVVLLDALARSDGHTALALFAALGEFWRREGEVVESYAMMQSALALPGGDDRDRAEVLRLAAFCATELADYPAADRLLDQAEKYLAGTDDPLFVYRVFSARAFLSGRMTDYEQMIRWSERAAKAARDVGSDDVELRAEWMLLQHVRVSATDRDQPDRTALEHCLPIAYELLERATASGNTLTEAFIRSEVASILVGLDQFPEALQHSQTALRVAGFQRREVTSQVLWIGLIAGRLGDYTTAINLTTAACRQNESDGYGLDSEDRRYLSRLETDARAELGDTTYNATRDGADLGFQDAIDLALTLTAESKP